MLLLVLLRITTIHTHPFFRPLARVANGAKEELAVHGKTSQEILDMLVSKGLVEQGEPVDLKKQFS